MSNAAPAITIPDDLKACQALVEQLAGTIEELDREKQDLQLAYTALLQQAFRRRSERYLNDPSQLTLDFGDSDDVSDAADGLKQAVEEAEQTIPQHTRRKPRKARNEEFPDHIPRREVEADVPDELKNCPKHVSLPTISSLFTVMDLFICPCGRRRTRMANFNRERGHKNGRIESVCAASSGDVHSQGPLGRRKSRTASAIGGVQAVGQTAEVTSTRPGLLGFALLALVQLAIRAGHRTARNGYPLASNGLQALLAVEVKGWKARTSSHQTGNT